MKFKSVVKIVVLNNVEIKENNVKYLIEEVEININSGKFDIDGVNVEGKEYNIDDVNSVVERNVKEFIKNYQ